MCVHKNVCVCVSVSTVECIYTGLFRGVLVREVLTTGFCLLVSLPICEVYRESQPKGDSKNWGFPSLVPVVSLLILWKNQMWMPYWIILWVWQWRFTLWKNYWVVVPWNGKQGIGLSSWSYADQLTTGLGNATLSLKPVFPAQWFMRRSAVADPEDIPPVALSRVLGAGSPSMGSQWGQAAGGAGSSSLIRPAPACPWFLSALAELVSDVLSLYSPAIECYRAWPCYLLLALKEGLRSTLWHMGTRQGSGGRHCEEKQCWTSSSSAFISSSAFSSPLPSGVDQRYGAALCGSAHPCSQRDNHSLFMVPLSMFIKTCSTEEVRLY